MMQKRLKIAKRLLNPADSVLIVTIDEKEYLHLGCLLEEMFPEARIQMVSSVINPSGATRKNEFSRTDEYIFFVKLGISSPVEQLLSDEWLTAKSTGKDKLRWRPIRRQGSHDTRRDAMNQFYPIFLTKDGKRFIGTGETLDSHLTWKDYISPDDVIVLWPLKPNGTEGCWQIGQSTFEELLKKGFTKISHTQKWGYVPKYLAEGERKKIERGQFPIVGYAEDGSIVTEGAIEEAPLIPGTQWRISTHSARENGSILLGKILPDRNFPFPKSLYAVQDAVRFFISEKTSALIVDFFAGSGTTLHAVNLLNAEDGGKRRCIMVTNNEVSAEEATALTAQGYQPGDAEWEKLGIARYVNWPRTVCSIEGHDVNGNPLKGNYLGSDLPMADGFKANAVFFKLGFLDKNAVALGRQFKNLLSILWMKAGAYGPCPVLNSDPLPDVLMFAENRFAVLTQESAFAELETALAEHPEIETVYIITDYEAGYCAMAKNLKVKYTYQLYRDYLDNFRINTERN